MAGEIDSGWVRIGVELGAWVATLGGLVMHVRGKLKAHDEQFAEHKAMIVDLQSKQAASVRPQDIAHIREIMSLQEKRQEEMHKTLIDAISDLKSVMDRRREPR